jgi:hypothetical protein
MARFRTYVEHQLRHVHPPRATLSVLKADPVLRAFAQRMVRYSVRRPVMTAATAKTGTTTEEAAFDSLFAKALSHLHSEGAIVEMSPPPPPPPPTLRGTLSIGDLIDLTWPGAGNSRAAQHRAEETYEVPGVDNLGPVLLDIMAADPHSTTLKGVELDVMMARLHRRAEWANISLLTVKNVLAELDRRDRVESRVQGWWRLLDSVPPSRLG